MSLSNFNLFVYMHSMSASRHLDRASRDSPGLDDTQVGDQCSRNQFPGQMEQGEEYRGDALVPVALETAQLTAISRTHGRETGSSNCGWSLCHLHENNSNSYSEPKVGQEGRRENHQGAVFIK